MPPRNYSRHMFTRAITDLAGDLVLTDPVPFRFVDRTDNRTVVVSDGETLFSIAAREFMRYPRPDGLWWVIADFQPDPIHDPTLRLEAGSVLIIPSDRTLEEEIFDASRRDE